METKPKQKPNQTETKLYISRLPSFFPTKVSPDGLQAIPNYDTQDCRRTSIRRGHEDCPFRDRISGPRIELQAIRRMFLFLPFHLILLTPTATTVRATLHRLDHAQGHWRATRVHQRLEKPFGTIH